LNFIFNGAGVLRVVGDHSEEISDLELILVGSKLPHCWMTHNYNYTKEKGEMFEITIQFHKDLLDEKFLRRNQLIFIKSLLEKAGRGINFLPPKLRLTQKKFYYGLPEKWKWNTQNPLTKLILAMLLSRST